MAGVTPAALRASLTLLGAAAVLQGCGAGSPPPVTDRDAVLRVRLDEYRITPTRIRVRAGLIRIVARNRGVLTHNVRVEEATDEEAVTPREYAGTATMQPGGVARTTVRLAPGHYRLVCTLGNHQNLGQYADLVVFGPGS